MFINNPYSQHFKVLLNFILSFCVKQIFEVMLVVSGLRDWYETAHGIVFSCVTPCIFTKNIHKEVQINGVKKTDVCHHRVSDQDPSEHSSEHSCEHPFKWILSCYDVSIFDECKWNLWCYDASLFDEFMAFYMPIQQPEAGH